MNADATCQSPGAGVDAPADVQVTPDAMIPDLVRRWPQVRAVLDRYGLRGCGGELGPAETLGFFARVHGVDEPTLLAEVRAAIRGDLSPAATTSHGPAEAATADTIYRRFFIAGIAVVLTAGATWGAWLLWRIGLSEGFTRVSVFQINAHGHAQIFGWVGLFIMGFAYQAFPRMWHTELWRPRLAPPVFLLMLAGLIARTLGLTLAGTWNGAVVAATAGGIAELLAITLFATQIAITLRNSGARMEPYIAFVLAALAWFVVQAAASAWYTTATMLAENRDALLWLIATYQSPLRDLQIHGLALFMILGVSLRLVPALYGVPATPPRQAWTALGLLLAAVIGEVALFVAYRWTSVFGFAAALLVPWLLLAAGVLLVVSPWRLWRPLPLADRTGKFIRAAYAWLGVSLAMQLLFPAYRWLSGLDFSHAYHGAVRHAITVGFITLMIMGVAARVVPTLRGIDPRRLPALWGPFLLVNTGCTLRVVLQVLTDWNPVFFAVVGVSGVLEVAGLAWWGAGLVRLMLQSPVTLLAAGTGSGSRPERIDAQTCVADIWEAFPEARAVFARHGFSALENPLLRRTVARTVSVAQAARMHGIEPEDLVRELNAAVHKPPAPAVVMLHPQMTVRQVVGNYPQTVRAFHQMGIDPETTGDRTLAELAAQRGESTEALAERVREAAATHR